MKHLTNVLTVLTLVFLAGCAKQKFYPSSADAVLRQYVESFVEAYGGNMADIIYNFMELEAKAATCATDGSVRIITVDPDVWEDLCKVQKKALVWHELGHCVLGRGHTNDGDPPSYMSPALRTCEYFEANEEELDAEMFN